MELLRWQWSKYSETHSKRLNLVIHLMTTPLFGAGLVLLPWAVTKGSWLLAGLAAGLLPLVVALQGYGHSHESRSPAAFKGPRDVIARVLAEQLITFPRFVLSGGCRRAWQGEGHAS